MKKTKTEIFYLIVRVISFILLFANILGIFLTKDDSHVSRLIFNTIQSILMIIFSFFPAYLEKKGKITIPNFMEVIFLLFCIAHFILGEINDFYINVPHWDSMLHTLSSAMLAILSFSIIDLLNDSKKVTFSPFFVAVFALSFTMTIEVGWEVIEYWADVVFHTNMQRFRDSVTNIDLIGQFALQDTMKDIMLDFLGATIVVVIGYFGIKNETNIFKKWQITKKPQE